MRSHSLHFSLLGMMTTTMGFPLLLRPPTDDATEEVPADELRPSKPERPKAEYSQAVTDRTKVH
jgi:hypothetical protein